MAGRFAARFRPSKLVLMAQDDGKTRGVLPLVEMKSSLLGTSSYRCRSRLWRILADAPQYETALATAAADLAAKRGRITSSCDSHSRRREVRRRMEAAAAQSALVIPLNADPDTHWSG